MLHLLGSTENVPLVGVGAPSTGDPCTGDVDTHAEGTDQVGIEGHQVAVFDYPSGGFLVPRVRAGTGAEQAGLDPLAASDDVLGVEDRPQIQFGHAGFEG